MLPAAFQGLFSYSVIQQQASLWNHISTYLGELHDLSDIAFQMSIKINVSIMLVKRLFTKALKIRSEITKSSEDSNKCDRHFTTKYDYKDA